MPAGFPRRTRPAASRPAPPAAKAAQSGAARSPGTVAGRLRRRWRWQRRWHRWRQRANPARQTAAGGAPDCPSPGRRRPPMIRAGRQAAGATGAPPRHCVLYASLPSFFCKSYVTLLTLRFFYAWETAYFLWKSPYLCIVRRDGGCRISGQNFFEIRRKKLLTNPPESCIIRPSERNARRSGGEPPRYPCFPQTVLCGTKYP